MPTEEDEGLDQAPRCECFACARIHACHMRRRKHARGMRRRIHAFHMRRRIHACHMRRRIHACARRALYYGYGALESSTHRALLATCHMRRRIHACHMRRRIHACHIRRRIHACHIRRRIHACHKMKMQATGKYPQDQRVPCQVRDQSSLRTQTNCAPIDAIALPSNAALLPSYFSRSLLPP